MSVPPISPSHAAFVARLAGLVRRGGAVLDAACGTGTHWPALLAAGLRVTGVDQSAEKLAQARRAHSEVPSRVLALQDLAGLPDRFDGLLCAGALEYVAPADWPLVTAGFAHVLRPRAPAYITVEPSAGPPRHLVRGWLRAAGFTITDEADADSYWHLLLTRLPAAPPG